MPTTARSPSSRTHSWSFVKRSRLIRICPLRIGEDLAASTWCVLRDAPMGAPQHEVILRKPPPGPRFARPEDRLRGCLEGRTALIHRNPFPPAASAAVIAG